MTRSETLKVVREAASSALAAGELADFFAELERLRVEVLMKRSDRPRR